MKTPAPTCCPSNLIFVLLNVESIEFAVPRTEINKSDNLFTISLSTLPFNSFNNVCNVLAASVPEAPSWATVDDKLWFVITLLLIVRSWGVVIFACT